MNERGFKKPKKRGLTMEQAAWKLPPPKCKVKFCKRPAYANGLCKGHQVKSMDWAWHEHDESKEEVR